MGGAGGQASDVERHAAEILHHKDRLKQDLGRVHGSVRSIVLPKTPIVTSLCLLKNQLNMV